jgi:hypothetical protein
MSSRTTWLRAAAVILTLAVVGPAQDSNPGKEMMPLERMVKAIQEQPLLAEHSFFYDDGFKALGSFSIHDHFAKRMCMGYLLSDGRKLAYRYIRAMPGLGSSNDAFETEMSNLARVEYKFYKASTGMMDYYPERLSVKCYFKSPIIGLLAKWEKKDMKFDIWDANFGRKLMEYIKQAGVEVVEKES